MGMQNIMSAWLCEVHDSLERLAWLQKSMTIKKSTTANVREGNIFEKTHIEEEPGCRLWMCTEIQHSQ